MFVIQILSLHVLISIISRLKCQVLWYGVVSLWHLQACWAVPNYAFAARPCWSSLAKFTVTNVLSQTWTCNHINAPPYQMKCLMKCSWSAKASRTRMMLCIDDKSKLALLSATLNPLNHYVYHLQLISSACITQVSSPICIAQLTSAFHA